MFFYLWTSLPQRTLEKTKAEMKKHIKAFEKEVDSIHRQEVRSQNLQKLRKLALDETPEQAEHGEVDPPSPRKTITTVVMFRNFAFTGRDEKLNIIHQRFFPSNQPRPKGEAQTAVGPVCYVLHGLGGTGKTHTALEYTYLHRKDFDAIFWLPSERDPELAASFALIAFKLDLMSDDGMSEVDAKRNQGKVVQEARVGFNKPVRENDSLQR